MKYVCSKCKTEESVNTPKAKCDCGGLWKLDFKPPVFDKTLIETSTWGLFRYKAFLPLADDAWKEVTLGEGMTPIIPLDDQVMVKMDYMMPTLSFKDRGAAMLIAHCKSIGVSSVVQDSSGNAGNSVAAYCAKADIACEIFVPEGTSPKKIDMIKAHGAKINIVSGSRDHCADVCRDKVKVEGVYYASHVFNPFFYEGTKTYVYEIYEQLGRVPENIFVPLGNGTLFLGIVKGLEDLVDSGLLSKIPQIIVVQSANCDPIYQAARTSSKVPARVKPTPSLAEGIAIGQPMRGEEILDHIYKYGIQVITAPEDGIMQAREKLALRGIYCEHTTAATYAAYLDYVERKGPLKDVLLPLCGAGLKSDH